MQPYDVIVVLAGHAGCEAALAVARLGGEISHGFICLKGTEKAREK